MSEVTYDVIIVGGGPAGLTCAIYASREKLNTLLLEKVQCGGLLASTDFIENYPGFPDGIAGMELSDKFKQQAQRFGTEIIEFNEVKELATSGKTIKVKTEKGQYSAYALVVATGSIPKKLNVPGEEKYRGKGVSYCATCDGPLFRNKDIAVIGCGNSGLQEGEALLKYVQSVTFVEFLPQMSASKILQERLKKQKKATFFLNHALSAINGTGLLDSITLKDRKDGQEKQIKVSGVFIYAGLLPNSKFLQNMVKLDKSGYIITNEKMETSLPGIYAIGDLRADKVRQVDVACAEGTIAAISIRDYLKELE
ncbi:MAG: thioredoxin-disulfide reductase [Omnitrophica bacterium]|nr:thioredoxin-disulfide reductase [Candidatus Omnitrophota bacterium]